MADEEGLAVSRSFEGNDEAIAFYSDYVQLVGTADELILQFYETIPNPPDESGGVSHVTTRLKASIMLSQGHARRLLERLARHFPDTGGSGESDSTDIKLEQP